MYYVLLTLFIISCFVLIMFVLLQPGKSDAAAVFGGGANSSAFGPRGTQTVMAKITIAAAIIFFLIAFLFSIPGLFSKRSLGDGVGPAEASPIAPESPLPLTPAPANQAPATAPAPAPATTPTQPTGNAAPAAKPAGNAAPANAAGKPAAKPADTKPAAKPAEKKTP